MEANGGLKSAECYAKIYFVGGNGAGLEIWKAWQDWRRRQGHRGVRSLVRKKWVLVCWEGDR